MVQGLPLLLKKFRIHREQITAVNYDSEIPSCSRLVQNSTENLKVVGSSPEAVFLVVCDPSMNEL
jgi:hypothetical protein